MMVVVLPPPRDRDAAIGDLVAELADHLGERAVVDLCCELLEGADRADHLTELPFLTGLSFAPGSATLEESSWHPYWVRTWGARGLLYVWDERAAPAVVTGLGDAHWRPAEMCLKVSTPREIGAAGDGAARLAGHELPRVRAQAVRTLGAVGDTEHLAAVRACVDDPHPDVRRQAARALDRLVVRLDLPDDPTAG